MAKEGKSKSKPAAKARAAKSKPPAEAKLRAAEPVPVQAKPGLRAYVLAVLLVVRDFFRKNPLLTGGIILLVLAVIGFGVARQLQDRSVLTSDELIIEVSRELGISGDGNPAIIDVVDESKVSQPFLEEAKNGDKVLLYYKAGKSVLFRPSEQRIVRSGTFRPPDAKVFIRQGSSDDGKLESIKQQLTKITEVDLVSQDYSTKWLNDKTIVINLTDRYPETAQKIAEALGATTARLPKGETIPDADILVIVGIE